MFNIVSWAYSVNLLTKKDVNSFWPVLHYSVTSEAPTVAELSKVCVSPWISESAHESYQKNFFSTRKATQISFEDKHYSS